MSTVESNVSGEQEQFHLLHIIRPPDSSSFVAVAMHARTGFPVEATIDGSQMIAGLLRFYRHNPNDALWYLEQLNEHNFIEPRSVAGTPLYVSPNELIQFGFEQGDVCRVAVQGN